jgi:hypothetical protein
MAITGIAQPQQPPNGRLTFENFSVPVVARSAIPITVGWLATGASTPCLLAIRWVTILRDRQLAAHEGLLELAGLYHEGFGRFFLE